MLIDLEPYPEASIGVVRDKPRCQKSRYTMCMALADIYQQVEDPEVRLRLRYVATLAKAVTDRLSEIDQSWLRVMYPRLNEYDELMREK
jgi:hypothetical protein